MLPVKPYRQQSGYCGPASLKMVLAYFGVNKSERELGRLSGCTSRWGTPGEGLLAAARKLGFEGKIIDHADIGDLRAYVKKKIPVIVDWFSTDEGHYSVVVDVTRTHLVLQDPEFGRTRSMTHADFKRVWFDFPGDYLKTKSDIRIRRMIVINSRRGVRQ